MSTVRMNQVVLALGDDETEKLSRKAPLTCHELAILLDGSKRKDVPGQS